MDPPGDGRGGALWISVTNCDIAACSFVSNSAAGGFNLVAGYEGGATGGAIYRPPSPDDGKQHVIWSTVPLLSVGSAQKFGQAIYNDGGTGVLTHVTKVTLVPVSSPIQPPAGGITSAGNYITLRNCILASTNISWDCIGNLIDGGGNISSDGTPAFTQPTVTTTLIRNWEPCAIKAGRHPRCRCCRAVRQLTRPVHNGASPRISGVIPGRMAQVATSARLRRGLPIRSLAHQRLYHCFKWHHHVVGCDFSHGSTGWDLSGPGLPTGASVVAPQCADAIFVPSNRVVNMPPDATGMDFYSYRSNALMISQSSNAALQILFAGQPGGTYRLLASSNLQTWSPCVTNTLTSDGLCQFVETNQVNSITRIFRMVRP